MSTLSVEWIAVSQQWAQLLLMWSWQSALLVGALIVIARISRFSSSSARHHLWLLGMIAVAVLPFWDSAARLLPVRQPLAESVAVLVRPPLVSTLPEVASVAVFQPEGPVPDTPSVANLIWGALFLVWSAGVGLCLVNVFRSYRRSRRLRRTAIRFRPVRSARGFEVPVAGSAEVLTPQLAGILHPMILLPLDMEDWSTREEMRGVILHELAHLERRDPYAILFQAVLGSLFFFHPLVRYGLRQLSVERELACDELVTSSGLARDVYAEAILKVAEHSAGMPQRYELAFDSSRRVLERRMEMILNGNNRQVRGSAATAAAIVRVALMFGVITCLFLPPGELAAQLQEAVKQIEPAEPTSAEPIPAKPIPAVATPPQSKPVTPSVVLAAAIPAPVPPPVQEPQPAPVSLSGRVYDQTSARIPGVSVTLISGQTRLNTLTNESGTYRFPQLPAGSYELEARLPGFQTFKLSNLRIDRASQQQDVTLNVGSVATRVQVTAQRVQQPAAAPTTPPPAPPAPPVRIGGDVSQANLIHQPKPQYPASMRASGIQGEITIQAIIAVDGSILSPRVLNTDAHPDLAEAALRSVMQWRYKPTTLNGVPIEVVTTITVGFGLTD